MSDKTVLVIDDDPDVRELLSAAVQTCGLVAVAPQDHRQFEAAYRESRPAVVVSDLQMPDTDGIQVLRFLAGEHSDAGVILMSGFDSRVVASAERIAVSLGLRVLGALTKPLRIAELQGLLQQATARIPPSADELLSAAEAGDQLVFHYQPKVCLIDGSAGAVVGAEALARWHHPRLGLLQPGSFIELAEREGAIGTMTHALLDVALRQLARWHAQGLDLKLAINLSPFMLNELDLPDQLAQRTREAGCDPTRLTLELTESGTMDDPARAADILTRLRLKGFELSIDDFGTGYSSLVQLQRMPFSELKIDRSFVMGLSDSEDSRVIVRALVDLAHNLSLSVCAEGIETQVDWDFLTDLGCERGQGYLIARPLPPDDFLHWLETWEQRPAMTEA